MQYVIIGNGIAGVRAAEAIRSTDSHGAITMIGDESVPPYSRPMISHVLDGSQPHRKLAIRSARFYDACRITPLLGRRADGIDVANRRVRVGGDRIAFDRLLIASGADPRPHAAHGMNLKHIYYMRTQAHVQQQVAALVHARRAVVLGGGLVGFKAAYGLLKRGLDVTMLITSHYPLAMQVDATAGKMILDELVGHGLKVMVGVSVTAFEGNGSVQAAVTDAGTRLPCDMAIIGKGVLPSRSFIPKDRIEVDLGVVVDTHLQTSVPGIYAAGDAAELVDIARRSPLGQRPVAGSGQSGQRGRIQHGRPAGGLPGQPQPQCHACLRSGCAYRGRPPSAGRCRPSGHSDRRARPGELSLPGA